MRLEAWFVSLPMDEFLYAADSADQQEAEQFLVVVVAGGALVEVAAGPRAERQDGSPSSEEPGARQLPASEARAAPSPPRVTRHAEQDARFHRDHRLALE